MLGFIFFRFGILPLLIWHYTVDALYTALLLFRSHNTYYIASAALSSFVFAVPMLISIALYIRNRGFVPDEELSNATLPVYEPLPDEERETVVELPPPMPLVRSQFLIALGAVALLAVLTFLRPPSIGDAADYRIDREQAKSIARTHFATVARHPMPQRVISVPLAGFKSWDRDSPREDGGSPDGFDSVAATYIVRHGVRGRAFIDILRHRVEAGTWTVRFFTPMQKDEYFVEIDPRTSRAVGYHRYQDERNPGPRLEQPAAQAIAAKAFPMYGRDPNAFDLKEALAFQQSNRRDWLFHFQDRTPIVAEAVRRVSVRVAGDEVTQFTTTVKVPDEVYRDAQKQTLLNFVFKLLQIAGAVILLSLVVTGFVFLIRHGGIPWMRAARWTAALAIVPVLRVIAHWESTLFSYNTSVQWPTFRFNVSVDIVRSLGFQLGGLFLALAAIFTLRPWAGALLTREGRARFGRSGVVSAISAIAIFQSVRLLLGALAHLFPSLATVQGFNPPAEVAMRFPAILACGNALVQAIGFAGAISMFAFALKGAPRLVAPLAVMIGVFCSSIDATVPLSETPLMLFGAAAIAVTAWFIARHILGDNPIAWPLTIVIATAAQSALEMLGNSRLDLQENGIALLIALALLVAFIAGVAQTLLSVPQSNAEPGAQTGVSVHDHAE
jgi:hypothetical protein